MDTRRTPKRVFYAHPPDQSAQLRINPRPPSPRTRFSPSVASKAGSMPTHECLRLDDRYDLQNRRKPSIQPDQEPAVIVRQPDPAMHLTPQNDNRMSEHRILSLKPAFRLEWRGQNGQDEAEQSEHGPQTLGDSFHQSMRIRFSVHTRGGFAYDCVRDRSFQGSSHGHSATRRGSAACGACRNSSFSSMAGHTPASAASSLPQTSTSCSNTALQR